MKKFTLLEFRNIIKNAKHQQALNFYLNIDVDKIIYEKLYERYFNVFEMEGEFLIVCNNKEYFQKNKYAKN